MGNQDSFITIIGVIVMLLVGYLLIPVKKQKERTLNFSKNKGSSAAMSPEAAVPLNVFFNYNGHSFDAYEVLGVPAGSTLEEIQAAFSKSLKGNEAQSHEFYKAALNAIKQAYSRS